jgi:hypothetical protein
MVEEGTLDRNPMIEMVAGVSVGIVKGRVLLDLDYSEDSKAQVDLNVIATGSGGLVEVQGTAEGDPFSRENFDEMLYGETTSPGLRHPFLEGDWCCQVCDDPGRILWTTVCVTGTALELRKSANRTVCEREDAGRLVVGSETFLQHVAQAGVTTLALHCSILAVPWEGTGCATIVNAVVPTQG